MREVQGYKRCCRVECNLLVLNEIAYATHGLCSECWVDLPSQERKIVEVLLERQTAHLSTHHKRTKENAKRELRRRRQPGYAEKKRSIISAKRRAARRLAVKYRMEYLELLAQERAKDGLDPWPVTLALEYADLASKTMSRSETYAAVDAEAQDVDAAAEPRQGAA